NRAAQTLALDELRRLVRCLVGTVVTKPTHEPLDVGDEVRDGPLVRLWVLCDAPVEAVLRLLIDGHVVVVPERVAVSRQLLDAAQRPTKRRNARAEITKYGPAPSAADSAM